MLWLLPQQVAAQPAGAHITAVTTITAGDIGQYEKFEVGLSLDRAFTTGQPHCNPYNPADVSVEGYFTSPSGKAYPVRYGFYYKDYVIHNEYLPANDARYWDGHAPTSQPWRIRFAPDEPGPWQYVLRVTYWDSTTEVLPARTFTCVASANSGFLKVAGNQRNFVFDSGKSFFAIGSNVDYWGITPIKVPPGIPAPPPNSPNLSYCGGPVPTPILTLPTSQQFAFSTYTYAACDQVFRELQDNGGNFVRLWMQDSNWDLETDDPVSGINTLGYYEANQTRMNDMDRLLLSAREHGIYLHLSMLDANRLWSQGENAKWLSFPYHTSPALVLATPEAFFMDPRARKFYKNKIRYIVSRWGYSPNIASYELINEGDFVDAGALFLNPDKAPLWKLEQWTVEMAQYLKSLDSRHLQTIAYGPDNSVGLFAKHPELFDYSTSHHYSSSFNAELQRNYLTQLQTQKLGKPYQMQEYDYLPYIGTAYQSKFHSTHWATAFSGAFGVALPLSAFSNIHHPCWPACAYYRPLAAFLAVAGFHSASENQPIGNSAAAAAEIYGSDYASLLVPEPRISTHEVGLLAKIPAAANPAYSSPCDRLCPSPWPNSVGVAAQNYYEYDKAEYLVDGISVSEPRTGADRNGLIEVFALQNPASVIGWVHNKTHYWYNLPHTRAAFCDTLSQGSCPNEACFTCGTNPKLDSNLPLDSPQNTITPLRGQQLIIAHMSGPGTYRVRWFYTQPGLDIDHNGILDDGGFIASLEQPAVAAVNGQLTVRIPPLVALGADGPGTGPDYAFVITSNTGALALPPRSAAAPRNGPGSENKMGAKKAARIARKGIKN